GFTSWAVEIRGLRSPIIRYLTHEQTVGPNERHCHTPKEAPRPLSSTASFTRSADEADRGISAMCSFTMPHRTLGPPGHRSNHAGRAGLLFSKDRFTSLAVSRKRKRRFSWMCCVCPWALPPGNPLHQCQRRGALH